MNRPSSGSRAVRNLGQAMIEEGTRPGLASRATPQVTIYEGMLKGGGMLEETESGVYLTAPEGPWEAVWSYLLRVPKSAAPSMRCLQSSKPVVGLSEGHGGPVVCRTARVHQRDSHSETYDGGSTHVFVPEPTIEHFERLYRAPGNFSARFYPMDASHQALLAALNKRLFGSEARPSMLDVVRPLVVSVAKMPKYTRENAEPRIGSHVAVPRRLPLHLRPARFVARRTPPRVGGRSEWARRHPCLWIVSQRNTPSWQEPMPCSTTAWSKASRGHLA